MNFFFLISTKKFVLLLFAIIYSQQPNTAQTYDDPIVEVTEEGINESTSVNETKPPLSNISYGVPYGDAEIQSPVAIESNEMNYTLANSSNFEDMIDSSGETLMSIVNEYSTEDADGISYFRDALIAANLLDQVLGNDDGTSTYTVFAPTNAAIKNDPSFMLYMKGLDELPQPRWIANLLDALRFHIVSDEAILSDDVFDGKRIEIPSLLANNSIRVSQFARKVGGADMVSGKYDIKKSNGVLHVINRVMLASFMQQPLGQLELQPEYGPDILKRVSLVNVAANVDKARAVLNQISPYGLTHAGCRIRAFNRLEEYLPQTINDSYNVTWGELLNKTFAKESLNNFLEYSLIAKNYYYDYIPDNFVELVMPMSGSKCNAHMWITKIAGKLCFNNGCLIESDLDDRPGLRTFIASNGVGYVIDKCPICPGVAMLVDYATEFAGGRYNLRQTSDFFIASLWNLRNLSKSVGDGNEITLFASNDDGWKVFNLQDVTRLASDLWNPHKLDMLRHTQVQGRWSYSDLLQKYQTEGPFNLTSLAGQDVIFGYNEENKTITVAGGEIFYKDVQGTDGIVHFTEAVPLPRSMTWTVYDFAKNDDNFQTQVTMADAVFLAGDLKQLSPITVLFAPDDKWGNLAIPMEEISKTVLENMVFKSLLWCDTLRALKGQFAESHNQKYWSITVNDDNMPCFEFSSEKASNGTLVDAKSKVSGVYQSCITECDILARNGIVHHIDTVLLFEAPQTIPPKGSAFRLPGTLDDNYDGILKNSTSLLPTATDGGSASASGGGSNSFFQRPVVSIESETETKSMSTSSWSSCFFTILISVVIATIVQI